MRAYALTCEALAGLDSTQGKVQCAAAYLLGRPRAELAAAARFLAGRPLPPGMPTARVGASTIIRLVAELAGKQPAAVRRQARRMGDLGEAVAAALAEEPLDERATADNLLGLEAVVETLSQLGTDGARQRGLRLVRLFARADPLEAKYLTKLLAGSLRTGMQSGRVEEALAMAFKHTPEQVRRAHMLLGDIGLAATHAAENRLQSVRLEPFRPLRCMLAHPVARAEEVLEHLSSPMLAEDKYDGMRAQLHLDDKRQRLYSRNLEECTHLFPELSVGGKGPHGEWIFDGEVMAWKDDRPLPFSALQQRLGRRQVPLTLLLDIPVIYLAFDVLRAEGRDLIDSPLRQRRRYLDRLLIDGAVRSARAQMVASLREIQDFYENALLRGHEGAVYKDLDSPYRSGSRGRAWIKLKRPLATLEVVVTAADYGRGRRAGWLSDLTLAVRGAEGFTEVGKAYSGLTDAEIKELTAHLKATTIERFGGAHRLEPTVVIEVAF
ncbi:MAG: ATP-dependent DNA ligase, partial [Acidobacteriota bacterium]